MFDVGFSELLIIAVVALLVLGPERLPHAARFAGLWVRRARAQWDSVRAELERELEGERLKQDLDAAAQGVQAPMQELQQTLRELEDELPPSDPPERPVNNGAEAGDSLVSHLLELRSRLLRAVLAVGLAFLAVLPFSDRLYAWLAQPLLAVLPKGGQLVAIEVTSTFFVPLRLSFFAALMLAMPVVLYQLWAFVAPGLYQHEKRLARPLLLASTLLFYAGCAFTYFLMLPVMFAYLTASAPPGVAMMTDIGHYLEFVLVMFLAGGLSFEVPVAVLVAVILGWVTPQQLSAWRGYVVVLIFIIAAILTPPDGLSQIMMALPMCVLYEVGVLFARLLHRRSTPATSS